MDAGETLWGGRSDVLGMLGGGVSGLGDGFQKLGTQWSSASGIGDFYGGAAFDYFTGKLGAAAVGKVSGAVRAGLTSGIEAGEGTLLRSYGSIIAEEPVFCFPAGTQVLMADGTTKAIEMVKEGELVLADDPTHSAGPEVKSVTQLHKNWTERLVHISVGHKEHEADGELQVTGEHPIWTQNRGWVNAKDLIAGDELRDPENTHPVVLDVTSVPEVTSTYNLSVEDSHTFFVTAGNIPILVHNTDVVPRLYITYTAPDPAYPGKTYVGRASGPFATPEEVLQYRFSSEHHRGISLDDATIDRASSSYEAIRGREQQVLESLQRQGLATEQINGIGQRNTKGATYRAAGKAEFGLPCR